MSKIEDLIKQYCPNGCEWKRLGDVYTRLRGTPITAGKMKEIADENGDIRIFAGGKTVINAFEKDIPKANITRIPAVLVQSRGVIDFVYYDKPFTFKNEMWAYTHKDIVSVQYLHYILKNNVRKFRDEASGMGSMPQISLSVTEDFQIPVPPLPVQEEIVRILDSFTELEKELEKRKKQYEVYRDELLTFGDDVEWKLLKDVITDINTGLNPRKFFRVNTVDAKNYYVTIREMVDGKIVFSERTDRINDEAMRLCNNRSNLDENTVLFSGTGTIGRTVVLKEKPTNWDIKEGVYAIHPIVSKILPDYLGYILHASYVVSKYMSLAVGGTVNSVPMRELKNIEIPVPSLQEQQRIVEILDTFDTLTTDLTQGLPAEIKMRRRQYEYYMDYLFGLLK